MTINPEAISGVGELPSDPERTALLDFLAADGLRYVLLAARELNQAAALHPVEFGRLATLGHELQELADKVNLGLMEAGYTERSVHHVPESEFKEPASDPLIPRTNL